MKSSLGVANPKPVEDTAWKFTIGQANKQPGPVTIRAVGTRRTFPSQFSRIPKCTGVLMRPDSLTETDVCDAATDTDEGYPDSDSVAWAEGEGQHYLPDR